MSERRFDRSNALYERALRTIPLASQTFSKSAMTLVRGASPLFLERGRGAAVWDVDGNRYVDYVLGLLPVVLGYGDPEVDAAIRAQLERGISFSLATELEVELAELLCRLIPCAEMVRFGKNGSDATSAAIRLARAVTGRERVAHCGYHGWHDWYIGSTVRHLGVPRAVCELSASFAFNDADALAALLEAKPQEYAAVILEPAGSYDPKPGFLEAVRDLCDAHGAILVFDEIVTGFRIHLGGAQARYGVTPDLACFGKAMGNGMPIAAIVGRRQVMRAMDEIFFSGTFGGEALSLAASLATVRKLEALDGPARIAGLGGRLALGLRAAVAQAGLGTRYKVGGPDWRPVVSPLSAGPDGIIATSLFRQEMVAEGLLLLGGVNLCLAHGEAGVLDETLAAARRAFDRIAAAYASNDPAACLRGQPVQPVFQVRPQ